MRRGLRLTPWMCSSEPGTSASGDDERRGGGEVARQLHLAERQSVAGLTVALVGCMSRLAPAACSRSVTGRGGLDDRRRPLGIEAGEQDRRLDLGARDGQQVVDPASSDPRSGAAGAPPSSRCSRPSGERGSATRSIGRRDRDSSPVSSKVSPACPARIPRSNARASRVRAVDRAPWEERPVSPLPNTRSVSSPCSYTSTPSARTAAIVASVSAERPKPEIRVSPSQSAPIRTARWEIDLSPGTARCPTSRGTGSTRRPRCRRPARACEHRAGAAILTGNGV